MLTFFVSSTFEDLRDYRRAVTEQLRRLGHLTEPNEGVALDARPLDGCVALVRSCDVYVGIAAWRYGHIPTSENPEQKSITELEWKAAVDAGKPRLLFLLDGNTPWPLSLNDPGSRPDRPIDRVRKQWMDDRFVGLFTDPRDLALKVTEAVAVRVVDPITSNRLVKVPPGKEPVVPSFGSRSRATFPGRLIAMTLGRYEYSRASEFCHRLLETLCGARLAARVVDPDFKITIQQRQAPPLRTSGVTAITGPAGVGKSTYTSELLRAWKDKFEVVVVLRAEQLDASSRSTAERTIELEIMDFFRNALLSAPRRMTTRAISYALKSKRVLYIIEDLHHSISAPMLLSALRDYLQRSHRWGEGIKVVATTRERLDSSIDPAWGDVDVVALKPFDQGSAQDLFYTLCTDNDVPQQHMTEHGDKLSQAFATEPVRTPLFVVLSAWLAAAPSATGGSESIERVLGMTAGEVFDHFIRNLYRRSLEPDNLYPLFRELYEGLAHALWPEWESCAEDNIDLQLTKIRRELETTYPGIRDLFGIGYLERNGFLFRSRYLGARLYFPHHAIADYLTASSMFRRRDFRRLREPAADRRIEGLVPFFAEMMRDWDSLLELEPASFSTFVAVLQERETRGSWSVPATVISRLAQRVISAQGAGEPLGSWLALHDLLRRVMGRSWVPRLCSEFESKPEPQGTGIEILAAFCENGVDDYLRGLLSKEGVGKRFYECIKRDSEPVIAFLKRTMELGVENEAARISYRVLWQRFDAKYHAALVDWTIKHVKRLTRVDIDVISKQGSHGVRALAIALEHQIPTLQRQVSEWVAAATGKVLIPRGAYTITKTDGDTFQVVVNRSFLVPCENVKVTAQTSASAESIVLSRAHRAEVMTYNQAMIAIQWFKGSEHRLGVLFNPSREDVSEIFRGSDGKLAQYVIPNVEDRAIGVRDQSPPASQNVTRTSYRAIEYID